MSDNIKIQITATEDSGKQTGTIEVNGKAGTIEIWRDGSYEIAPSILNRQAIKYAGKESALRRLVRNARQ